MDMRFEITFDYLCPFARNANEAVIEIREISGWKTAFLLVGVAAVIGIFVAAASNGGAAKRPRLGRDIPPVLPRPGPREGR